MRHFLPTIVLAVASCASQTDAIGTWMRQLADTTTGLATATKQRDRDEIARRLDVIDRILPLLTKAAERMPRPVAAATALDKLRTAAADLRKPIGDGVASDRWDLTRLRAACTSCHAHNRADNADRRPFPNRHTALTGTIQLTGRDGKAITDRSGVVVFLERADDKPVPQARPPKISQRGRRFHPPVLVVTAGTTVRFPNDDVVFHNVFSLSRGNTFDLGFYGKGKEQQRTFVNTGLVKVHCNIHADMASHVLVLNSARHAVSAADGSWCIPDVPTGRYTLRVWHALAEGQRRTIEIDDASWLDVPIDVRETKVRVQHANKHGRRYRKKY